MLLKNNIPLQYIFGKIRNELIFMLVYTTAIAIFHEYIHFTPISIPLAGAGDPGHCDLAAAGLQE